MHGDGKTGPGCSRRVQPLEGRNSLKVGGMDHCGKMLTRVTFVKVNCTRDTTKCFGANELNWAGDAAEVIIVPNQLEMIVRGVKTCK